MDIGRNGKESSRTKDVRSTIRVVNIENNLKKKMSAENKLLQSLRV